MSRCTGDFASPATDAFFGIALDKRAEVFRSHGPRSADRVTRQNEALPDFLWNLLRNCSDSYPVPIAQLETLFIFAIPTAPLVLFTVNLLQIHRTLPIGTFVQALNTFSNSGCYHIKIEKNS